MDEFKMQPIGHLQSVFKTKNGTPRQSGLANQGRAILRINKNVLNNPGHALENLEEFSHVWLIWVFHKNGQDAVKAKVAPPRLSGKRVGLFSTRSPHRPNPIGLSLARVEKVVDDTLYLLGVDMIDGTPILDVKPYIPIYDNPSQSAFVDHESKHVEKEEIPESNSTNVVKDITTEDQICQRDGEGVIEDNINPSNEPSTSDSIEKRLQPKIEDLESSYTPGWIGDPEDDLQVCFTARSLTDLHTIQISQSQLIKDKVELLSIIREVLRSDPRSIYRKNRCSDRLYYTTVDNVHVSAWFDSRHDLMEVLALTNTSEHDAP